MSCPLLMHLKSFTWCSICYKLRQRFGGRKGDATDPETENPSPPEETRTIDEFEGHTVENFVFTLKVTNPKTLRLNLDNLSDEMVTYYDILFKSKASCFRLAVSRTQRRYSDFEWLRNHLYIHDKFRSPPELPPKYVKSRFDPAVIEERRKGLEEWLIKILNDPFYLSSMATHLFVQTEMNVDDIKRYLSGELSVEVVEAMWANGGRKKASDYTYGDPYQLFYERVQWDPEHIECTPEELAEFMERNATDVEREHLLAPPPPPSGAADVVKGAHCPDVGTPDSGYVPSDDASAKPPKRQQETLVVAAQVHTASREDEQSIGSVGQDSMQGVLEPRSPSLVGQAGSINADLDELDK